MKISQTTARIVRLAVQLHNTNERSRYSSERAKADKERFKASGAAALVEEYNRLGITRQKVYDDIKRRGFYSDGRVCDTDKARIKVKPETKLSLDAVLLQIAAADEKTGREILAGLKIKL